MRRVELEVSRKWIFVYRILILMLITMVLIILGGSIYAFKYHDRPKETIQDIPSDVSNERYFTGIGRIRSFTADDPPAMVILSIAFPYDGSDPAIQEELASHIRDFRELIKDFVASYKTSELRSMDEETIKVAIMEGYNQILRLTKIRVIYFNDFMILD